MRPSVSCENTSLQSVSLTEVLDAAGLLAANIPTAGQFEAVREGEAGIGEVVSVHLLRLLGHFTTKIYWLFFL